MKKLLPLAPLLAAAALVFLAALRFQAALAGAPAQTHPNAADPGRRSELAELSALDLASLVDTAKKAVERAWLEGLPAAWSDYPYAEAEAERGVAVRFVAEKEERGCLAFYRGVDDLAKAARIAALDAAFFDPRYEALVESEAPSLDIEVSVFGSFRPARGPMDFIVGEEALIMRHAEGQVLMQPSLARERGWDRRDFLEALCRKDGLEPGAWKEAGVSFMKAACVSLRLPFRAAL